MKASRKQIANLFILAAFITGMLPLSGALAQDATPTPVNETVAQTPEPTPTLSRPVAPGDNVIDDFESGPPPGVSGWNSYWEDNVDDNIVCQKDSTVFNKGQASMRIDFKVQPGSWGLCSLEFDPARNWQPAQGVSFSIHSEKAGVHYGIEITGGAPGSYLIHRRILTTSDQSITGWETVSLPWDQISQADWEVDPGKPIDPKWIYQLAVSFPNDSDQRLEGKIWIDDIKLFGIETKTPALTVVAPRRTTSTPPTDKGGGSLCPFSIGLVFVAGSFAYRRKKYE